MIKFNFILSDLDAENLFSILDAEQNKLHNRSLQAALSNKYSEALWHKEHAEYINSILQIILKGQEEIENNPYCIE